MLSWANREAWHHLERVSAPDFAVRPPMAVERSGRCLEASLHLPLDMACKALRASSRVEGVCYHP